MSGSTNDEMWASLGAEGYDTPLGINDRILRMLRENTGVVNINDAEYDYYNINKNIPDPKGRVDKIDKDMTDKGNAGGVSDKKRPYWANGGWKNAPAGDPLYANVVLLLPLDNNITDASSYAAVGSGTNSFSNTVVKMGTHSLVTTVGGGDILFADALQYALGTSDFCMETWAYMTAYPGSDNHYNIITQVGNWTWRVSNFGGNKVRFFKNDLSMDVFSTTSPPLNQWNHLAVTRQGNVFTLYLNGVADGSTTVSVNMGSNNIIRVAGPAQYFQGNLDDVRITVGNARYTGAFTPPTDPHPTS